MKSHFLPTIAWLKLENIVLSKIKPAIKGHVLYDINILNRQVYKDKKNRLERPKEIAQCLRTLATLAEELDLVPSPIWQFMPACDS